MGLKPHCYINILLYNNSRKKNKQEEEKKMTTFRVNGRISNNEDVKRTIEAAPGYTGAGTYDILQTIEGGYRVYKIIGGKAMDASLKDLPAGDVERFNYRRGA
jgi:hypothetical protein